MIVLDIFALWQVPARMRPLMETLPVKGHFLSMYVPAEKDNKLFSVNHKEQPCKDLLPQRCTKIQSIPTSTQLTNSRFVVTILIIKYNQIIQTYMVPIANMQKYIVKLKETRVPTKQKKNKRAGLLENQNI